jgi:PAP2 superfamily
MVSVGSILGIRASYVATPFGVVIAGPHVWELDSQQGSEKMPALWHEHLIPRLSRSTIGLLIVPTIATLLFAFGLIIPQVIQGEPLAFDRMILLAFRKPGNPSVPIGSLWLQEAARDVTATGSPIVLGIILFAVVECLFLARKRAEAWLILGAVLGGVVLNDLLKYSFARPRPDIVAPAVRVFTPGFPSGHATMSAITYLTLGALLARTHTFLALNADLFHSACDVTDLPRRPEPCLSRSSLSDRCPCRLVHRYGLGHGLLGADDMATTLG